jgi:hypothetical protein
MTERENYDHMVKVVFPLDPEDWHGFSSERVWAEPVAQTAEGGAYRVMNSPWNIFGVSFLDIVHAKRNADGTLLFDRIIKHNGHSTFMLLVPPAGHPAASRFDGFWKKLEELGCHYEWKNTLTSRGHERLFSVDVPDAAKLSSVVQILEQGLKEGIWDYQEGHDFRKQP